VKREATARRLGFRDVASYLAARVRRDGASISAMAAELGIARESVRDLLEAHRLERAELQEERQTLSRAGFDRFATYLTARHATGVTVTAMAAELGHTAAWVRIRARRDGLTALTRPPPQALSRARQRAVDQGFASLEDYVGPRYGVDGVTARQLKAELGLRPEQVARLLDACGMERRDDPDVAERRVLAVVGFDSLAAYAADRHADGVILVQMAGELGRSDGWLARRLRAAGLGDLIGKPGRARVDPPVRRRHRRMAEE